MAKRFERDDDQERNWRQSEEPRRQRQHYQDRGVFDRAGDELRSWFGDEDAERRRKMDESRFEREGERQRNDYGSAYGYRRPSESNPDYESQSSRRYRDQGYRSQGYGDRYLGNQDYGEWSTPYAGSYTYSEFWTTPGPHSGRGPAGYQRSDERIREDVCDRLTQHGQLDATGVEVDVNQGDVTLRGTVNSRSAKRMAEETAESVSGVRDVQNQIRVRNEESQPGDLRRDAAVSSQQYGKSA